MCIRDSIYVALAVAYFVNMVDEKGLDKAIVAFTGKQWLKTNTQIVDATLALYEQIVKNRSTK